MDIIFTRPHTLLHHSPGEEVCSSGGSGAAGAFALLIVSPGKSPWRCFSIGSKFGDAWINEAGIWVN